MLERLIQTLNSRFICTLVFSLQVAWCRVQPIINPIICQARPQQTQTPAPASPHCPGWLAPGDQTVKMRTKLQNYPLRDVAQWEASAWGHWPIRSQHWGSSVPLTWCLPGSCMKLSLSVQDRISLEDFRIHSYQDGWSQNNPIWIVLSLQEKS